MRLWKRKTVRIPTDREILTAIYKHYNDDYVRGVEKGDGPLNYVSIDIPMVAKTLGVEPNSVFGRLYYHLEPRYGYERTVDDRVVSVQFFGIEIGGKRHCVHFPLMMSVLAGLQKEHRESRTAFWTSILALVSSAIGVAISLVALLMPGPA